jgi:2'-5' RNA ligase
LAGSEPFEPHITLLGSVPNPETAVAALEAIATTVHPFTVELTAVVDTVEHFRCVVLTVQAEGQVVALREELVDALGAPHSDFWPHLSLLYADLNQSEREQLRNGIGIVLPVSLMIDTLCLADTGSNDVRSWSLVKSVSLKGTGDLPS